MAYVAQFSCFKFQLNFKCSVVQESIGTVDVKKKKVHFYVQRNSNFYKSNAIIPFELARLNEGNAFNSTSGIFTVPVKGIYYFNFSGMKEASPKNFGSFLQVNGINVGAAYTDQSALNSRDVFSLRASLRLAVGDRVNLFLDHGQLYDDGNHHTHFTGWLVDEELV